jgi:hypothetical protein
MILIHLTGHSTGSGFVWRGCMAGHAVITEDALERIRQRIGVPVPRRHPHISLASQDAIRHFAYGMGDDNPLWIDPAYAAATRYGGIIAPPCMLYALDDICRREKTMSAVIERTVSIAAFVASIPTSLAAPDQVFAEKS